LAGAEVFVVNAAALWLMVLTVNPAVYPTAKLIVNLNCAKRAPLFRKKTGQVPFANAA
jgi:hypothetical protein